MSNSHVETTWPVERGQRRRATILGRAEVVRIVEASRYQPRHWICAFEASGKEKVVAESELGELLPPAGTCDADRLASV